MTQAERTTLELFASDTVARATLRAMGFDVAKLLWLRWLAQRKRASLA